jgi:hypothetical protein
MLVEPERSVIRSFLYPVRECIISLWNPAPYKFSQDEIRDLFDESFRIDSIKETVYQGTLDPFPEALFVVMINQ